MGVFVSTLAINSITTNHYETNIVIDLLTVVWKANSRDCIVKEGTMCKYIGHLVRTLVFLSFSPSSSSPFISVATQKIPLAIKRVIRMKNAALIMMSIWFIVAGSFLGFSVSAAPTSRADSGVRRCDTQANLDIDHFQLQESRRPTPSPPINATYVRTIETYVHVVAAGTSASEGYIPEEQVIAQMNVLSSAYLSMGVSFHLASVDYTINSVWFKSAGPETETDLTMKTALRQGGANVLSTGCFI